MMEGTQSEVLNSVKVVFGLAFDVEKAGTKSGYAPAERDMGSHTCLFGNLRLKGFSEMLSLSPARLVLVGGTESRYRDEAVPVNRAQTIKEMLVHDFSADPNRIDALASLANTGGNIEAIKEYLASNGIRPEQAVVMSNHYHLPRARVDLDTANVALRMWAAESFLLMGGERDTKKQVLLQAFGGGPLAERVVEEIAGMADKLLGTYTPKQSST